MKLFEYEGKLLLKTNDIEVPDSQLVDSTSTVIKIKHPSMIKAQVLSGKRKHRGLITKATTEIERQAQIAKLLMSQNQGELIEKILVEESVDILQELFISITYSSRHRAPVLLFSEDGGVEIESEKVIQEIPLEIGLDVPNLQFSILNAPKISEKNREQIQAKVWQTVNKLWKLFQEKDLFLAEINPLAVTSHGAVIALDAKVVTDDAANYRQKWDLPERNLMGRSKSWAEIEAEKIDKEDHRGAVGRVYLDLEGDIGVIAAGGGASLVAMDAMVNQGLKPANYTEFSGNPPEWKVKRLTEIVLAKKGLRGAILIGGKANFTDQVETLTGFMEALKEIGPTYPLIVRRDGPRMAEAKAMLEAAAKKYGWQVEVYDSNLSIIDAVHRLVELVRSK